ncbi:T9SS type A sorting domain-containing protein [Flavobacterium sp. MDT1-60]|uniref:T9SS type A sorting domain-containing protein n=1 Tax=Flavobacterium sp. MDT1-60 TaxID=1979344 RepID=UPI00177B8B58|nr:T9SS type A sorting domain-containing protein [Flavobacterium sp. MDT1-60]QOG02915.1 T9SS type A sorting domain-containing protein [Flavobacterium sp. MDT1-60]
MKKTLLCFLFLFTTVFYAQDIVHCSGDNNFDLSKQKYLLIGNLDPDQTVVSYHLSLADATNNTNAIANPSNYNTAAISTTIYARINNNGTITTNSFNVKVVPALNIAATHTAILCSGDKASLTVSVSAGNGQYYYSLNGGSFTSSNTFTNLSAGVYSIQVLDTSTSCPTTASYTITAPTTLNATSMVSGQMATITAIGGTAPYQYSLEGVNFQSSAFFPNLTPGNYVFMVKDSKGCITTVPANILPVLTATAFITKEIDCSANSNAVITATAAGGQSPYTYSLNGSPFQVNNNFNNLIPGTYSIIARDAVNSISNPFAITINPLVALSATAVVTNPTNCSTGTITAIATGGKAPYIYSFDGGMTFISSNVFGTPNPGTYVIIVKDSKGCLSSSVTTTIQPATPLFITASNTSVSCNGGSDASLTINASGGKAPYQYTINNGIYTSSNIFTTLNAGTYTLKVRDAAGCVSTIDHVINQPTALTVLLETSGQNITLTSSGGTPPYQYSFDGGSYQSSNVFTVLTSGNYLTEARDSNGCTRTFSASVVVPDPLISSAILVKESDCISGASIAVNATGGQPPYAYSINGGVSYQLNNTFTNIPAGTYTVIVKDLANTVSNSNTIVVNSLSPITATAVVTPSDCINNSITVQATGGQAPYIYSIDGGVTYGPANVFTNVLTGTYNIVVKDSNSCVSPILSKIVQSPSPLVITASDTSISCYGSTASIIINPVGGQAPYEYSINNSPYTSGNVFANLKAGNYTIKVIDATGCTSTLPYTITEPSAVNADMVIDGNTISILGAQGGTGSYFYSIDNGNFQTNNIFTNVNVGLHHLRVKDSNNCEPGSFWAEIAIPISAALAITKPIECTSNAEITVTATGGFTPYVYSINGGTTFQASNIFTNLVAGTYTITVKDNDDKLYTKSITVSPLMPIYADFLIDKQTLTINGLAGTAPYEYSVDDSPFQTNNVFTNLSPGIHQVYIKDSKGCQSFVFKVTIENVNQLTASVVITKEADCMSNAVITANAAGGMPPYSYSINEGVTFQLNNVFNNVNAGTYSIVVKDANNDLATSNNLTVLPLSSPIISVSKTNVSCYQASDGRIDIYAQGGKAPYVYSINNSSFVPTNVFTNLIAGVYNVTVKDANGCVNSYFINIEQPSPITITASAENSTTINDNNGKITVAATGGVSSYRYALTNFNGITIRAFQTSNIFDSLQAGLYGVQVKDENGCIASKTDISIIHKINTLSATAAVTQITCNNPIGTITVTAAGGTIPYQYSEDNGITYSSSNVFNFTSGSYTLKVRDADNNTTVLTATIAAQTAPSFYYNTYKGVCSASDLDGGGVTIAALGGQSPYTYSLNGGPFAVHDDLYENLKPGTYTFSIKDANGCTSDTQNFTIEEPDPIISKVIVENQTITVKALGQGRSYEYSLDGITFQSNNIFSNLKKGIYTVYIKDYKGCTAMHSNISISEPTSLLANFEIIPLTCDSTTGKLNIIALGGVAPYQYSIDNGITYTSSNLFAGLIPGSYAVTVKDAQNATGSSTAVIKPLDPLAITTVVTKAIDCLSNASITATAVGGNAPYTYSIGNGYTASGIFTNLTSQTYTVSVKDAFGCIAATSVTISQPVLLSLSNLGSNTTNVSSNDGTITITASGGTAPYSYSLKYENGSQIVAPQTSSIFQGLSIGKYTIEVTDALGCKVTKSGITITSETLFGALMTTPLTCTALGSITINAAGGKYPHQYSFDNGINYGSSNIASNLQAGTYTIKVKDARGAIITLSATLNAVNPLVATTAVTSPIHCNGSNDAVIQMTVSGGKAPFLYSLNGSTYQSSNIFSNLFAGNYAIAVKDSNECSSTMVVTITEPAVLVATIDIKNNSVTVNATGGAGNYVYAISTNLAAFSTVNTFTNLEVGNYTIITQDKNGCFVTIDFVINPPAPLIESKEAITVDFKPEQTLADLIVEGQNIKWYSAPNTLEGKTSKTNENPLPLTTVLVDGTTYYASQTINGIESKERLAVTVKLNGALSTPDFVLSNFKYYPNPVLHNLTISNSSIIDEVEIVSVTGQSILSKTINSEYSEIDLSNVSSGVYLLKVKSEGKTKTVKIVKK